MFLTARSRVKQFLVQRIFSVCSAILFIAMSTPLLAQGQPPSLEQILPRVQDHVDEFAHHLPDFISNETITSSDLMGGKTGRKVVIESEFKGRQNQVENGRPFIESREIKTINGSPVRPDHQLIGPFFYLGTGRISVWVRFCRYLRGIAFPAGSVRTECLLGRIGGGESCRWGRSGW